MLDKYNEEIKRIAADKQSQGKISDLQILTASYERKIFMTEYIPQRTAIRK